MSKKKIQINIDKEDLKRKLDIKDGKDGKDGISPVINTSEIASEASTMAQEALKPLIPTLTQIEQIPLNKIKIRNELETLEGDDRLKIEAIKNLREELNVIKRNGGEHTVSTSNRGLYQLLDVNVAGVQVGQTIIWDGSQWVPGTNDTDDQTLQQVTDNGATTTNVIEVAGLDVGTSTHTAVEGEAYFEDTNIVFNGGLIDNVDSVKINTSATPITSAPGLIQWNTVDGTYDMGLLNSSVLQVGQETMFYGKASGAIANGDLCQFAGVQGDHILIKKAVGSEIEANPHFLVGVATENISNGNFGYVTWFGKINGVYTKTPANQDNADWVAGDILYFNVTTGQMTKTMPSVPNRIIVVAAVIKIQTGSSENGIIIVRPTFGIKMQDLDDVNGTALTTDGQLPTWHNTEGYFDFDKNIGDYWERDGSSTASGDWDITGIGTMEIGSGAIAGSAEPVYSLIAGTNCLSINQYDFTVAGDWRTEFAIGTYLRVTMVTSVFTYTTVSNVTYDGSNTTVNVYKSINSYYYGAGNATFYSYTGSTVATTNNIALFSGEAGGVNSLSMGKGSTTGDYSFALGTNKTDSVLKTTAGGNLYSYDPTYYTGTVFLDSSYTPTGATFYSVSAREIKLNGDYTSVLYPNSNPYMLTKVVIGGIVTYLDYVFCTYDSINDRTTVTLNTDLNNYLAFPTTATIAVGRSRKYGRGWGGYMTDLTSTYKVGTRVGVVAGSNTPFLRRIVSSTYADNYTQVFIDDDWDDNTYYGANNYALKIVTSFSRGLSSISIGSDIVNSVSNSIIIGSHVVNEFDDNIVINTGGNYFNPQQDKSITFNINGGNTSPNFTVSNVGWVGIGTNAPATKLHIITTGTQQRWGYDTTNYANITVGSTGITTFATVGAGAAFNFSQSIRPNANDGSALGTTALSWSDLFLASGGVVNFNNGDVTITHAANQLTFAGATTNGYRFSDGPIAPSANDGVALGTTALSFADLFLASGGVVNFANGDVTITHASNQLTFAGATTNGYKFSDGPLSPVANDGVALGTTALSFSDLFLASGAVINFANSDVTITHSAGTLTLSDADNIAFGSTTGTKIGTATTQKIGFFNATPVVQQVATTDLGTVLSNLGLRAAGTAYPITTSGNVSFTGTIGLGGQITVSDGINFALNATTGTKIGTATTQKLGFYNTTPIVQPANTVAINDTLVNLGLRASGGDSNFSTRVTEPGTFAEIYVADGVTAQSIPTGATYTKLTAFTTNGSSSNCTADSTNDKITITKAGKYLVNCSVSGFDGASGAEFKMALFYDGVEQNNIHATNKFNAGSEIDMMSMSGILVSAANKDIDVRLKHGEVGSVNFTTQYANLTITYIGE